ncbi:MAG: transporter substrate-binding domain-containing protein [Marinobacter sp.]|nr:transporter substrate-binding domain-containing protein [Marinobacter sp.]
MRLSDGLTLNRLLLSLVLAWGIYPPAWADTDVISVARFASAEVWPWGFEGQDGEPQGILFELAEQLVQQAGVSLSNDLRPHRRAILELAEGIVDFSVLFETPAVSDTAFCLDRLLEVEVWLVAPIASSQTLSLSGLSGKSVGYIRGTWYGQAFSDADSINKVPVQNLSQAIDMLIMERIDAVITSHVVFLQTLRVMGLAEAAFRYERIDNAQHVCLYMSRKAQNPALAEPMREAARRIRESGAIEDIIRRPWPARPR